MKARIQRHTIVFTASAFVALRITENAMRPTLERVWKKLSSDEALDLYAYVIVFANDMARLLAKLAIAAGRDCRRMADCYIESCLDRSEPKVETFAEPQAIDPAPEPEMAQESVIETAVSEPVVKSVRELRIDCSKAGVTWKNAHGKGKHMRKAEMEAALGVIA